MPYRYSPPLPDQRADLLGMLRAHQSNADQLATARWLAEPTWPERNLVVTFGLRSPSSPPPRDCAP